LRRARLTATPAATTAAAPTAAAPATRRALGELAAFFTARTALAAVDLVFLPALAMVRFADLAARFAFRFTFRTRVRTVMKTSRVEPVPAFGSVTIAELCRTPQT
jgi:hypothetical protein